MAVLDTNPVSHLQKVLPETRAGRMCFTLCEVYPERMAAKRLILRAGLSYHTDPFRTFIELCAAYYDINRFLAPLGWQVERTGGTPDDFYRLTAGGGG